jgi:hypothetical protein
MSFLEKIFGRKADDASAVPEIRFGRYADNYRTLSSSDVLMETIRQFEKGEYLEAYKTFLQTLYDENEDNIRIWDEKGGLRFEFFQGSKKISGYANLLRFYAESKIAKVSALQSSFMRRLLEMNYELKYSRFTLTDENEIAIIFDSNTLDGSPLKLYTALRELAVNADKNDDIMIDEFEGLEPVETFIRRELPEAEKEVKYNYIIEQINAVFEEIEGGKLSSDRYPVAYTYLLLNLCYKLDYLTKPEGFMMETLETVHRLAFAQDGKNIPQKNLILRKELNKLLNRPKEKFFQEMYEVRSTFGITTPVDHAQLVQLIEQELPNMKWYMEQGHETIAMSIPGFIVGQSLFNYTLPEPDKAFFHLFFRITEPWYFASLGFRSFLNENGFDEKAIKNEIRSLQEKFIADFPNFNPNHKMLVFRSRPAFAESWLQMVKAFDLSTTS